MTVREPRRPVVRRWLVLLAGGLAALLYANFLLVWALDGRFDVATVISMMEEPGQPHAAFLRVTDVVCAALVIAIVPALRRALPAGAWRRVTVAAVVIFALCAAAAAVIPARCQAGWTCTGAQIDASTLAHDWLSTISDTFLYVSMAALWCAVRRTGPVWLRRAAGWGLILGGLVSSAAFGYFNATGHPVSAAGASQRVHVLFIAAWIAVLAVAGALGPRAWAPGPASASGPAAECSSRGRVQLNEPLRSALRAALDPRAPDPRAPAPPALTPPAPG